jgi:DNA-binding CsgD family transcriptional regulator
MYPRIEAHFPAATTPASDTGAGIDCIREVLDEIDYGVVLVSRGLGVKYCNHVARAELQTGHPLSIHEGCLRSLDAVARQRLEAAVHDAADRMLRCLLTLDSADGPVSLSVVPIGRPAPQGPATVLLLLGRRDLCARLSTERFASEHGLTAAEAAVLTALVDGLDPRRIAALHGVSLSTIRTQIQSLRDKTGAGCIRDLVMTVATLPPLLNRLRN